MQEGYKNFSQAQSETRLKAAKKVWHKCSAQEKNLTCKKRQDKIIGSRQPKSQCQNIRAECPVSSEGTTALH